jgi:hypothetical protein
LRDTVETGKVRFVRAASRATDGFEGSPNP